MSPSTSQCNPAKRKRKNTCSKTQNISEINYLNNTVAGEVPLDEQEQEWWLKHQL